MLKHTLMSSTDTMFTTDRPETKDFFYEDEEVVPCRHECTNSRYKFFRQSHFTIGDYEQFLEHWDQTNPSDISPITVTTIPDCVAWEKYKNIHVYDIFNTFLYMSEKFKKGIYLKITDGKGKCFLPFSKVHYKNEWSQNIRVNPATFRNLDDLFKYNCRQENREYHPHRFNNFVDEWYGNNGLVRIEYPVHEGESGINMIHDMFSTLLLERKLSSVECFINKRDFPILKKDGTESYDAFFHEGTKLLNHDYARYAPILGMTTTSSHADIPIPTWEDWARVASQEDHKVFLKEARVYPKWTEFDAIPWEDRQPTAVFRGASTGLGTTIQNNPRLYFSYLSSQNHCDSNDGIPFLDAGITKWNLRPRKHPMSPYLETIMLSTLSFQKVAPMTPLQQIRYKYILHLPGHSFAYRLSLELGMGCVVLMYPSPYKIWYSDKLVAYQHYVPIDPKDPLDIFKKIAWCKANDEKCYQIAQNARAFAETHLSKKAILDYLEHIIISIRLHSGIPVYPKKRILDITSERNERLLSFYKKNIMEVGANYGVSDNEWVRIHVMALQEMHTTQNYESLLTHPKTTMLRESRTTHIYKTTYHDKVVCIKKTQKQYRREDLQDVVAGIIAFNALQTVIPHYVYTYGACVDDKTSSYSYIMTDFVEGVGMDAFLDTCSIQDIILLFAQCAVVLHNSQSLRGAIHNDLYPWNVIIKTDHESKKVYSYELDDQTVFINYDHYPVFIDYGKSVITCSGWYHQTISPFSLSRIRDILCLVMSSLFIYLKSHKVGEADIKSILYMMNFWVEKGILLRKPFYTITNLKHFLKQHKNFSGMLFVTQNDANITTADFFKFLWKAFPFLSSRIRCSSTGASTHPVPIDLFLFCPSAFHRHVSDSRKSYLNKRVKAVVKGKTPTLRQIYSIFEWYTRTTIDDIERDALLDMAVVALEKMLLMIVEKCDSYAKRGIPQPPYLLNTHTCLDVFENLLDDHVEEYYDKVIMIRHLIRMANDFGKDVKLPTCDWGRIVFRATSLVFYRKIYDLLASDI